MQQTHKVIMLIDMDAFFASCMQAKYPIYRNKPIVICQADNKAVISTASYEARKMGVKSAMPLFKAKTLSNNKIIVVVPEYPLFIDYSQKIWQLIHDEFSPKIETASIDEWYVDITDFWPKYGSPKMMGIKIKQRIKELFNLTCSIGISNNKFLAKMISNEAKPNGVSILNPKNYRTFLWTKKISELYGVGPSTTRKLTKLGITTVQELAISNEEFLIEHFGKYGQVLKKKANGIGNNKVQNIPSQQKSISNETTLDMPVHNEDEFLDVVYSLIKQITNRAVKSKLIGQTFYLGYHYKWTKTSQEEFDLAKHRLKQSWQITTDHYTNNVEEIFSLLKEYINKNKINFDKGINLIAVGLKNLIDINSIPKQYQFKDFNSTIIDQKEKV